jgi:hypothetical protein
MNHAEYYPPFVTTVTCSSCGATGRLMVASGCFRKFPEGVFVFVEDAPCDHIRDEALEAIYSPLVYLWGGQPGSCVAPLEVVQRWGTMGYTHVEPLETE